MRPLLSIKTLYRSPVKTFLTFILLTVVTFAFFSQTAEYAVTAREFNSAAKQYSGVGSAEVAPPEDSHTGYPFYLYADPRMAQPGTEKEKAEYLNTLRYQTLTGEQIDEILALPYITSTDTRYMTAGVSDAYYRLDDGKYFYNYSARCVIEATLKEVQYGNTPDNPNMVTVNFDFNRLILEDCTLLAGNVPWEFAEEAIMVFADFQKHDEPVNIGGYMERVMWYSIPGYVYDTAYVRKYLTPGGRYVFVIRFEPLHGPSSTAGPSMFLYDYLTESWCGAVWPLDGVPEAYLETEAFAPLRELVALTNADAHTFDMVYTEDMGSIMRFAEGDMAILEGRALTPEDSANGSEVCVINQEFSKDNNLKIGDTITMKLGTELFEQYKGLGAVAASRERFNPADKTLTLEIVGIYGDTDGPNRQSMKPNWSYSVSTVFVPKALLPVDESTLAGHVFSPAEFSFKIGNAWDIPAFLEEAAPRFEAMGLKLIFDDDGWLAIAQGFMAARQIALIKIAVLASAVAAATGFVVYLFIGRKKKEYAIMRALGTTRNVSARSLLLPLMSVAAVSVLAGSAAGWIYTVKTITQNNTLSLLKEYAIGTSVPAGAAIGCIAGELLLTLLIAILLLRRIGSLSPLSLLQDSGNRRSRSLAFVPPDTGTNIENADVSGNVSTMYAHVPAENTVLPAVTGRIEKRGKSGSIRFILRYIERHMRRSAWKSALAVLLAALLFVAIGQLALMKDSYSRLCAETVIKAKFVGGLELISVPPIMRSGYFVEPYYEVSETADLNGIKTDLIITNNIARYTGEEADITYADGYDASVMDTLANVLIVGRTLLEAYGLKPGETVSLSPEMYLFTLQQSYIRDYKTIHPEETITDGEILALFEGEIAKQVARVTAPYIIAGVISTPSGKYDRTTFMPGDGTTSRVIGKTVKLDVAEFALADNMRADEVRSNIKKMDGVVITVGVYFFMDTSELENLRNTLRLLETMYPIALTAALLIGGFLCCLVIVQSSKEAAIMRILGTTKRKTRTMLVLEQVFLGIAGLVIGACGLLLYKGSGLKSIIMQLSLFIALYFAVVLISAVICSVLATRRNVLELLQTKE